MSIAEAASARATPSLVCPARACLRQAIVIGPGGMASTNPTTSPTHSAVTIDRCFSQQDRRRGVAVARPVVHAPPAGGPTPAHVSSGLMRVQGLPQRRTRPRVPGATTTDVIAYGGGTSRRSEPLACHGTSPWPPRSSREGGDVTTGHGGGGPPSGAPWGPLLCSRPLASSRRLAGHDVRHRDGRVAHPPLGAQRALGGDQL